MSTIYDLLRCTRTSAAGPQESSHESHLLRTPEIVKRGGALSGMSRAHGDASPQTQDRIIDILVEIGARYKLPYRDIAHLLLICKISSGFNPDTASPSSSAAGLAQLTDQILKKICAPDISKSRLGFTLIVSSESVFDAEMGAYAVLLSYMTSKELSITHFGKEYEKHLYFFHHDSWSLRSKDSAAATNSLALSLIEKQILPLLDTLGNLLITACEISFKLLTNEGEPCESQPFIALYPNKSNATGIIPKVQGTISKAKFLFGKTDVMGCTSTIKVPGLSEVIFVILNREYKQLLSVNSTSESDAEPDATASEKFVNDNELDPSGRRKITRVTNSGQVPTPNMVQPYTGEYLWRRPPMGLIEEQLREAFNMTATAAVAMVEHKRSHIALPAGNQAQKHNGIENVVVIRTGTTLNEIDEHQKTAAVPHETAETDINKKVVKAPVPAAEVLQEGLLFPLARRPNECYRTGSRAFNSSRGVRRHAGCDLYAPLDTEVRAMADGIIVQCYSFYWETDAIEVLHGEFIVRYCEIQPRSKKERKELMNQTVARGETIGNVGQLIKPDGTKYKDTMLHLEMYSSTVLPINATDSLTQRKLTPFERRADLVDPSNTLDKCSPD